MVLIGIWKPSLVDAVAWVNDHAMANNVVQFVEDTASAHGSVWIVCRVTQIVDAALHRAGEQARPRWTFLPEK